MPKSEKFKVLIVDDEPDILEAIEFMLSDQKNLMVLTAVTAEHAIKLLPFVDGVIADCVLPHSSELDSIFKKCGKPVIRMSGKISRATNLAMPKPFTSDQLKESIEMLKFFSPNSKIA